MIMIERAYKVELDPNNQQRTLLVKHANAARFAYNWGLARWKELYKQAKKLSPKPGRVTDHMKLHKELNALKGTEFPWMYEVSKCAPQEALIDLGKAFDAFFRGLRKKRRVGYPKFKDCRTAKKTFRLHSSIKIESKRIRLPRLGWLRLKEANYVPLNAKIRSVTVSEKAGRWYASVQVQEELNLSASTTAQVIGIDLGLKTLATCSDGTTFENPRSLHKAHSKIKRLSRKLHRQVKESKNRRKTQYKLARAHARAAAVREDAVHKVTSWVAKTKRPAAVVIEDLNVSGMLKNRRFARAISDAGFQMLRDKLEYKCKWYGSQLIVADRFYPSSKTCSRCAFIKKELKLSERVFVCEACKFECDRDLNAALNLEKYFTASSAGSACREDVRPSLVKADFDEAGREH